MKNKFIISRQFFLLATYSMILNACSKMDVHRTTDNEAFKALQAFTSTDSATVYNHVWINADQTIGYSDSSFKIGVTAVFTDSITHQLVAINSLTVNNRNIPAHTDHTLSLDYSDSAALLDEGISFYGSNVKVKITGSSAADTVTKMVYVPKRVVKIPRSFPTAAIDISNNLTIGWTTDPLNSWGNVVIKIWYNAATSQFLSDSTLSSQNKTLTYIVPDNGSYTISSTDLQGGLQRKSFVTVALGRGTQVSAVLPVSHRRVFYFATASETSQLLYLK